MNKLIYHSPAYLWREALPLGNGLTGVMVFGGKSKERLAFNDGTLWSGYPKDQSNPESKKYIDEVRRLVFEGKNNEADRLCMEKLCGAYSEGYLPLGELLISFLAKCSSGYERSLDLDTAVQTVKSGSIRREAFCSYPDKLTVYRIDSDSAFSVTITAKSKLHYEVTADKGLNLTGNAPDYVAPNYLRGETHPVHYEDGKGMSFCLRCEAQTDGDISFGTDSIIIKQAKTVTLFIATATGFCGIDKMPETSRKYAADKCRSILNGVDKNYDNLRSRHIDDYKSIYERQKVTLSSESVNDGSKLLKAAKSGTASAQLCGLLYDYGKYLMISGSRKGGSALNLQGIWNSSVRPPWSGNYTTNINTQMNYWGMSRSGLSECAEPLIGLVKGLMEKGAQTAQVNYGCEGFCCNHNADIWCKTTPVQGAPAYMYAPLCGAWLSNELYGHFKNGELDEYSEIIKKIVTEAAKFVNDYLVLHDGYYVTAPSASPEATFTRNGKEACLDYAGTFEMSITRQLFSNYLEFADDELAEQIKEKLPKLYPIKHGSTGILEWHDDVPITENGHRHFSPLYGFYPADIIKYYSDKEKTQWVRELFDFRTSNSTQYIGWSAAWAISLCGRLHNSQKGQQIINSMLAHSVFKNMFCVHPPFLFQIDGNLGFVAGVNELLLYEENGVIELLPALPESWKDGSVKDMVIKGNHISFEWKNGIVTKASSDKPVKMLKTNALNNAEITNSISLVSEVG